MNEKENLLNVTGRIHQLVNYGLITVDELNQIQSFCSEEISKLNTGEFIEREYINWEDYDIQEQTSPEGEITPGLAVEMTGRYQGLDGMGGLYRNKLELSVEVARGLFGSTNQSIRVHLGELDNGLIIFLYEDTAQKRYYVISNRLIKEEINSKKFDSYKEAYKKGKLKEILDLEIRKYNPATENTLSFTVSRNFFTKLESESTKHPNLVISFHPAIHVSDEIFEVVLANGTVIKESYKHRMTFIMILGYYKGDDFQPISGLGVYDRNGLCPPGC